MIHAPASVGWIEDNSKALIAEADPIPHNPETGQSEEEKEAEPFRF